MGKLRDLTGKIFGRLTVIDIADKRVKNGGIIWKCKCNCGNITEVSSGNLIRGLAKSCGCLQKEIAKENGEKNLYRNIKNIIGNRFGRLTVLNLCEKRYGNGSVVYLCKCDCGNKIEVPSSTLLNGNTKSCGCLSKEKAKTTLISTNEKTLYKNTKPCILTSKVRCDNSSGYKGVYLYRSKWKARIQLQGKVHNLGTFMNKEDAIKARQEAEEKYFKPIIKEFNEVKKNESI